MSPTRLYFLVDRRNKGGFCYQRERCPVATNHFGKKCAHHAKKDARGEETQQQSKTSNKIASLL